MWRLSSWGRMESLKASAAGRCLWTIPQSRPSVARTIAAKLSQKGVQALDAPVSGGDIGARDATLTIMVGGDAGALEKVMPVFKAMSKTVTHVGDGGSRTSRQGCKPDYGGGADGCDGRTARFFAEGGSRSSKGCGCDQRRRRPMLGAGREATAALCGQSQSGFQGIHAGEGHEHCSGNRPRIRRAVAFDRAQTPSCFRPCCR